MQDRQKVSINGNGLGFGSVLFLIFLVLKLTHVIDWSWWWVFAPFWLPLAVILAIPCMIAVCAFIGFCIISVWEWAIPKKKKASGLPTQRER